MTAANQIKGQMRVLVDVLAERKNQDAQWGGPAHDDAHYPIHFAGYVGRQISKAIAYRETNDAAAMRARFVKIAALAFAAVESIDRKAEAGRGEAPVEYCYSTDGETYHGAYSTAEEALREGISLLYSLVTNTDPDNVGPVWVGEVESPRHVFDSQGDNVINQIQCELYDEVGDHADNFIPTDDDSAALDALIAAWCDANLDLSCFSVGREVEYRAGNPLYDATLADVIADDKQETLEAAA